MNANQPRKRCTDRQKYQWTHLPMLLRSNMVQRVFGVSARDIQRWAKEGRIKPVYTGVKRKQPKYRTLQVAALLGVDVDCPAAPVFIGDDVRETVTQCATESLERFRQEIQDDLRQHLKALTAVKERAKARSSFTQRPTSKVDVVAGGGTY